MRHIITSVILIIGAVGLFISFTQPRLDSIGLVKSDIASYDDALKQVETFKNLTAQLSSQTQQISPQDKTRLANFLPQNLDNVRLIIEIDALAQSHGLSVSNMDIKSDKKDDIPSSGGQPQSINEPEASEPVSPQDSVMDIRSTISNASYNTVTMSFSVNAKYDEFKKFMTQLEKSLRLIDVSTVSGSNDSEGNTSTYDVSFTTYWLGN